MLLFSMVAHEYAHGWVAYRNGDPTAYQLGRLTWNPLRHIDPFLTIILPLLTFFTSRFIFGGAKPVPVNPRNYRNYKRGDIAVSLAGIVTNIALACVFTLLIVLLGLIGRVAAPLVDSAAILQRMLSLGIWVNILLAGFNLLPIPPLDGSHVAKYLLPPAWALRYERAGRFGIMFLLLLMTLGGAVLRPYFLLLQTVHQTALRGVAPFILPSAWTL